MIYAGGIWTVAVLTALAFGYARVFGAPKWIYVALVGAAFAVIGLSQILPASHPFSISVRGDLVFLKWVGLLAIPVSLYVLFIRWARRESEARNEP